MNTKQFFLVTCLLVSATVQAFTPLLGTAFVPAVQVGARLAGRRMLFTGARFGKARNAFNMRLANIKGKVARVKTRVHTAKTTTLNAKQKVTTFFAGGPKRAAQATATAGLQVAKQNPRRTMSTLAGAGMGYHTAGDRWSQKATGTLGGAWLGFTVVGHGNKLNAIGRDVTWLRRNTATHDSLAQAVKSMQSHASQVVAAGTARTRQTLKALMRTSGRKANAIEKRLGAKIDAGFAENKALHAKASKKISDIWGKWFN